MSFTLDAQDAPGIEEAERVIEHCDEIGSEVGVSVNAETIHARDAGCAIVEHAKSMGVDMLLVGAGERPSSGRTPLKSTAEFVLNNASCAVVVGRFPVRPNGSGH
jgi:nucleotide-binding universal stress UspA family protein